MSSRKGTSPVRRSPAGSGSETLGQANGMASKKKPSIWMDPLFRFFCKGAATLFLLLLILIFVDLSYQSRETFFKQGWRFLITNEWDPVRGRYGALSSLYGTAVVTFIGLVCAFVFSVLIALFLVEIGPKWVAKPLGYGIELLAAIPSIIFGMWGLFVLSPLLADYVQPWLSEHLGFIPLFKGPPMGIGMFTAGIILTLMVLPYTSSMLRDLFAMTPPSMREAAYGMGATRWEMVKAVTFRYHTAGMAGALLLGFGRAIGETMAITFVIGNNHEISASLFDAANTITSTLANEFTEAAEPSYISALMALALVLFCITFVTNALGYAMLHLFNTSKGKGR